MKRKTLKSLKLNKKSISNFNSISGGIQSMFPCSATILPSCLICDEPDAPGTIVPPDPDTNRVCDESIKICV